MKNANYLQKRLLIFGLILNGCQSTAPIKKRVPVYVVPVVVPMGEKNMVCYTPEDHEKLMLNFLE
jgi:hypothetical protein